MNLWEKGINSDQKDTYKIILCEKHYDCVKEGTYQVSFLRTVLIVRTRLRTGSFFAKTVLIVCNR